MIVLARPAVRRHRFIAVLSLLLGLVAGAAAQTGPWNGNFSGDRLGYAVANIGDVDGDGQDDVVFGTPLYSSDRGWVVCRSGASGVPLWSAFGVSSGDRFGFALAGVGDVTGDGVVDVLVGAPGYNGDQGALYVLRGTDGVQERLHSTGVVEWLGRSVASLGDLNGDGAAEYAGGAPGAMFATGLVRIHDGATGGVLAAIVGDNLIDNFGAAIAGRRDRGTSGGPDLVVGAPFNDTNGSSSGQVRVFSASNGGTTWTTIATRYGDGPRDHFGTSVALMPGTGGFNNTAVLVGAPEPGFLATDVGPGYVRIFTSTPTLFFTSQTITGMSQGDRFGRCVAYAGDLDQDGRGDYAIGAPMADAERGRVRVYGGRDGRRIAEWLGNPGNGQFGFALDTAGDFDGDGRLDLIVGAPFDDTAASNSGQVSIVSPPIAPYPFKLMITELCWTDPDGVEITNFGDTSVGISNWRVMWSWGTGTAVATIPSGTFIAPGESIVVHDQSSAAYPEVLPTTQVFEIPGFQIPANNTAHVVTLITASGIMIDEVRVDGIPGQPTDFYNGGAFRGIAMRGTGTVCIERIWGLDSNSGADWTAQPVTSMGLENLGNGPRGTDPIPVDPVLINEYDGLGGHLELLVPATGSTVNFHGWHVLASGWQGMTPTYIRPLSGALFVTPGGLMVLSSGGVPFEFVSGPGNVYVPTPTGQSLPLSWGTEHAVALYDAYGRVVDTVRFMNTTDNLVHNDPRLPSAWDDFGGAAPGGFGVNASGRVTSLDTDSASDWRQVDRTMGAPNSGFFGVSGDDSAFDVRLNAGSDSRLTIIVNGGAALAGSAYGAVFAAEHTDGNGPLEGLSALALPTFANPPFGVLDASGSARIDLPGLPAGLQIEAIFYVLPTAGGPAQVTKVIEYES